MLTIRQIEYDRLIADYKDMRAHFAVVCADRGCLPPKKGAYNTKNPTRLSRKSEYRNPKSETNSKFEIQMTKAASMPPSTKVSDFEFWISHLFRISIFGFRIFPHVA